MEIFSNKRIWAIEGLIFVSTIVLTLIIYVSHLSYNSYLYRREKIELLNYDATIRELKSQINTAKKEYRIDDYSKLNDELWNILPEKNKIIAKYKKKIISDIYPKYITLFIIAILYPVRLLFNIVRWSLRTLFPKKIKIN